MSRKTSREDSPELNNREINATIKKRKKKIKCPKACDMKKYEKFDKEISEILRTNKETSCKSMQNSLKESTV